MEVAASQILDGAESADDCRGLRLKFRDRDDLIASLSLSRSFLSILLRPKLLSIVSTSR